MRIVSQDNLCSVEFENVILCCEYDCLTAYSGTNHFTMGKFRSESRCEEVFDRVHKLYAQRQKTPSGRDTGDIFYIPEE